MTKQITVYKSNYCLHSRSVEAFLTKENIAAEFINIDGDPDARTAVMALNNGNASVPTLLFSDGTQLTEPSLRQLRAKLQIESPSFLRKLKDVVGLS